MGIDDGGAGTGFPPFLLAHRHIERMMDALQRAVPVPQVEIVVDRALGRKVLGQPLPLAARPQNVEDGVEHLADIDLAPAPAALGGWDQRRGQRPFRVRHIAGITKTFALCRAAMLGLPHPKLL